MASRSAQPIDEEAGAEAGLIWDKKERVDGDRRQSCHRQTTSPCLRGRREQLRGICFGSDESSGSASVSKVADLCNNRKRCANLGLKK